MPTYAELLNRNEWRDKRSRIILRDKYLCQNCANTNIIENCVEGIAAKKSIASFHFVEINIQGFLVDAFISKEGDSLLPPKSKVYYNFDEDKRRFNALAFKDLNDNFIFVPGLHVHHKYYQERLMPWEYPDNALITYCWRCHEELHSKIQVPKLDARGNKIGKLTPCFRCYGAGEFSEYNHVHAGICFRCEGSGYEELMAKRGGIE